MHGGVLYFVIETPSRIDYSVSPCKPREPDVFNILLLEHSRHMNDDDIAHLTKFQTIKLSLKKKSGDWK